MVKKQNATRRQAKSKTSRRIQKNVIILSGLAFLLLTVLFVVFMTNVMSLKINTTQVKASEISDARDRLVPDYEDTIQDRMDVLKSSGVVSDSINYSAAVDACLVQADTAGWSTKSWLQNCTRQDVNVFQTGLSSSEVVTRLADVDKTVRQFGELKNVKSQCGVIYQDIDATLTYVSSLNEDSYKCKLPNITEMSSEASVKKNVIKSFSEESISRENSYVILQSSLKYFTKKLGCKSGMYIGCSQPISAPVVDF